jgi:hypothetical protein
MSAATVQQAVLYALRQDARVKAVFGDPARLIDDESEAPAYPFARLESHSVRDVSTSQVAAQDHVLAFNVFLRSGGFQAADDAMRALRDTAEQAAPQPLGAAIILIQTLQCEILRAPQAGAFRGTLRLRIVSEEGLS